MATSTESGPDQGDYHVVEQDSVPSAARQTGRSKNKQVEAIQRWLHPTDYNSPGNEYMKHLHAYVPGTGSWVRESPAFRAWTQNTDSIELLHVRGVPGSGKSVFAASTIRQLQEAEPGTPVLFFFFRQIVEKNHSAKYLVRDFASQLLPYNDKRFARNLAELSEHGGVDGTEMDTLWKEIARALRRMPEAYCVVDALDEMDDGDIAVIEKLVELGTSGPGQVRVMLTSRPIPRIEETLRNAGGKRTLLKLEPSLNYSDVAKYVDVRLLSLTPLLKPETEDRVKKTICGRSQGLFLLARLVTDNLTEGMQSGHLTEDRLPGALERLPRNLENVYQEMLQETARRTGIDMERQAFILMWVTCSRRPLRLIELGALAIDAEQQKQDLCPSNRSSETLKQGKDLVRASCGRLLEILEDETVSVIHHSFTEFLYDASRSDRGSALFPVLDSERVHASLAVSLLKYLDGCPLLDTSFDDAGDDYDERYDADDDFGTKEFNRRQDVLREARLTHPSLIYAADHLVHHVQNADLTADGINILDILEKSLVAGMPAFGIWMYRHWGSRLCGLSNALHVAIYMGLPLAFIKRLTRSSPSKAATLDVLDGDGRSPVSYAVELGPPEVAQHLLDSGYEYVSTDRYGYSPLHHAVEEGHFAMVKLLLARGVTPLDEKTRSRDPAGCYPGESPTGTTALEHACRCGDTGIISVMLPLVPSTYANLCLHWTRQSEVMDMILDMGLADVDCQVGGKTTLFNAANAHNTDAVRVLLWYGADPNKRCSRTKREWSDDESGLGSEESFEDDPEEPMLIHGFVGCGSRSQPWIFNDSENQKAKECLRLLLEGGSDVNATCTLRDFELESNDGGVTPLLCAVAVRTRSVDWETYDKTPVRLASMLLAEGADPTATSWRGNTAAHYADPAHLELFEILASHGADMDARNCMGMTPLHCVATKYKAKLDPEVIRALVRWGANVNATDGLGNTVFHYIFRALSKFGRDSLPVFRLLLDSGADISKWNKAGIPPLHYWEPASKWLVQDTNLWEEMLQGLSSAGLDVNVRDKDGRNILWEVLGIEGSDTRLFDMFVRLGADVRSRTKSGSTLLHSALQKRLGLGWVNHLVSMGVDPHMKDANRYSLLLWASKTHARFQGTGNELPRALLDRLVELDGGDLEETDEEQRTALHSLSLCSTPCRPRKLHPVRYLLTNPASISSSARLVNARDRHGAAPIHYAASISEDNVVLLIEAGADPSALTDQGVSPLHIACRSRQANIVGLLIDVYKMRGTLSQFVDLSHIFEPQRTSLHLAVRAGRFQSVDYLLANGADVHAVDGKGLTALHILAETDEEAALWNQVSYWKNKTQEMVDLQDTWRPRKTYRCRVKLFFDTSQILASLLEAGADINAIARVHDVDVTPLDLAISKECHDVARQLAGRGALTRQQQQWRPTKGTAQGQVPSQSQDGEYDDRVTKRLMKAIQRGDSQPFAQYVEKAWGSMTESNRRRIIDMMINRGQIAMLKRFENQALAAQEEVYAGHFDHSCTLMELACRGVFSGMRVLRLLLETFGLNVDAQSVWCTKKGKRKPGSTALHAVAQGKRFWHMEAVKYLLSRGAALEIKNRRGQTPLLCAIASGPRLGPPGLWREKTIQILLEHGADPNTTTRHGMSCLDLAPTAKVLRLLIEHGADATASPRSIHNAIRFADDDMVHILLAAGADANYLDEAAAWDGAVTYDEPRDDDGLPLKQRYALHEAARPSRPPDASEFAESEWNVRREQVVQVLLEGGADPLRCYPDGRSVMHAILEEKGLIAPILEHYSGLDLEVRGQSGRTLLLSACLSSKMLYAGHRIDTSELQEMPELTHTEAIHSLLDLGAACDAADSQGQTPLHYICQVKNPFTREHEEAFKSLVDRDPSCIHVVDKAGHTPLHLALQSDQWKAVRTLVDQGANTLVGDCEGNTALHFLARKIVGEETSAKEAQADFQRLVSVGMDVNARNNKGETPAFICRTTSWEETPNPPGWGRPGSWALDHDIPQSDALDMLMKVGADIFISDQEQRTLLHALAGRRHPEDWRNDRRQGDYIRTAFEKLVGLGLDPRKEDAAMWTAIDLAVINAWTEIVDLFSVQTEDADDKGGKPSF